MSSAFDRWVSRNAPDVRDDPREARHTWSRIADRLHQRRQRRITRGVGLAAAAVVVAVLGFVDVNPLGGHNWNLEDSGSPLGYAEDPFTGKRYSTDVGTDDGMIADIPAKDAWEVIREQQAAKNYTLDSIDFVRIQDEIEWMLFNRHWVGGKSVVSNVETDRESNMSSETSRWLAQHYATFTADGPGVGWLEEPARQYRVNGRTFWFRVWKKDTERGPLYYGTAIIPDDSK